MKGRLKCVALVFSCCAAVVAFAGLANAGTVILEGSDAITFHCNQVSTTGACAYEAQSWKALVGGSGKPIAVIEGSIPKALGSVGSGITIDNFLSVAAAGALSGYAAVYIQGDNGDNAGPEGNTAVLAAGASAALSAYLAGGGTVMIEDYQGGAAFDAIVGTTGGAPAGTVAGFGATVLGTQCDDGETVTPTGTLNGFTQPPPISCWTHQGYNEAYFATLGFNKSYFNSAPGLVGGATTGWSSLLANGNTITGGSAPEASSMMLLLLVLLAGAFVGKRYLYES